MKKFCLVALGFVALSALAQEKAPDPRPEAPALPSSPPAPFTEDELALPMRGAAATNAPAPAAPPPAPPLSLLPPAMVAGLRLPASPAQRRRCVGADEGLRDTIRALAESFYQEPSRSKAAPLAAKLKRHLLESDGETCFTGSASLPFLCPRLNGNESGFRGSGQHVRFPWESRLGRVEFIRRIDSERNEWRIMASGRIQGVVLDMDRDGFLDAVRFDPEEFQRGDAAAVKAPAEPSLFGSVHIAIHPAEVEVSLKQKSFAKLAASREATLDPCRGSGLDPAAFLGELWRVAGVRRAGPAPRPVLRPAPALPSPAKFNRRYTGVVINGQPLFEEVGPEQAAAAADRVPSRKLMLGPATSLPKLGPVTSPALAPAPEVQALPETDPLYRLNQWKRFFERML